jgi:hypothetical protein
MRKGIFSYCLLAASILLSPLAVAQDASFNNLPVLQPNIQPGSNFVTNDINGDGFSDLLWFNPTTSQFGYWLMSIDANGNVTRTGARTVNVTPGYYVAATGDFNGDGKVDLIWTSANHDIYLWTGTGTGFQSTFIDNYPAGWQLIGAGHIDGDGSPDLLWWNASTNQFGYWLMKNGKRVGLKTINVTPGYNLVAIGYYTPTKRLSLLWASPSGDVYDWDSQGDSFTSYYVGNIRNKDGSAWAIDGIAYRGGGLIDIQTVGASEQQYYSWSRQFDAQGYPTSATFSNPEFGGRFPNSHIGGFIYDNIWTGAYQTPSFVFTDISYVDPSLFNIYANGPYEQAVENSTDSFSTTYPQGWYLIGAKSNQNL